MSKKLVAYFSASGVTGATIREGKLLNGRPSVAELKKWVDGLGL